MPVTPGGAPLLPPGALMPLADIMAGKQASRSDAAEQRRDPHSTAPDPGPADRRQASGGGSRDAGRRVAAELLPMVLSLAVGGLFFRCVMKRLDPNYAAEQRVRPHTDFVNLHSSPHVSEKSVALESKLLCCIHFCAYF